MTRPALHGSLAALPALAAFIAIPALAHADPPSPKVCVVVAGDPDETARTAAQRVEQSLAARSDLRVLTDDALRAVLRGETSNDAGLADLVSQRRSLHGDDTDGITLNGLGHRLGCALTTEIASRPEGVFVRSYDVVHHGFVDAGRTYPTLDAPRAVVIARDASRAVAGTLQLAWGVAANARLVLAPPPPPAATTSPSAPARNTNQGPGIISWVVAGGAALVLIGGFLLAQTVGPSSPVITVSHGLSAGSSP